MNKQSEVHKEATKRLINNHIEEYIELLIRLDIEYDTHGGILQ